MTTSGESSASGETAGSGILSRSMGRVHPIATPVLGSVASTVLPGALAVLTVRYWVPTPGEAAGTGAELMASFAQKHLVAVAAAFFVGFAALGRYWVLQLFGPPNSRAESRIAGHRSGRLASWGWAAAVFAAALALIARNRVGIYRVESASMLPTLEPLEVVAGSRLAHGKALLFGKSSQRPDRGDLVVFENQPGASGPALLVKRVVGLPGDHISMEGALPVINGERVRACEAGPYVYPLSEGGGVAGRVFVEFLGNRPHLAMYAPVSEPWTGTYDVKPGEVFVLGDNRNNSSDSRSWNRGRGAGLRLGSIEARVARRLFGVGRDERVNLGDFMRPLELSVGLPELDTSFLRDGIRRCLNQAPAASSPSPPRSLWPSWPAERWFHHGDGSPIVLDEPVLASERSRE